MTEKTEATFVVEMVASRLRYRFGGVPTDVVVTRRYQLDGSYHEVTYRCEPGTLTSELTDKLNRLYRAIRYHAGKLVWYQQPENRFEMEANGIIPSESEADTRRFGYGLVHEFDTLTDGVNNSDVDQMREVVDSVRGSFSC